MRRALCTTFVGALLCPVVPGAQNSLPALENAWILGARSYKQPSTQSPLELTLRSGARITVRVQDVHQYATAVVRSGFAWPSKPGNRTGSSVCPARQRHQAHH